MLINQALAITGAAFPKFPVTVSSDRVCVSNPVLRLEIATSADVSSSVQVPYKAIATLMAMPESNILFNGEKLTITSSIGRASFQYATACATNVFPGDRPIVLPLDKGAARKLGEVASWANPSDIHRSLRRGVTIVANGAQVVAMASDGYLARTAVLGSTTLHGRVVLTQECAKAVARHFDAPVFCFGESAFSASEGDVNMTGRVLECPEKEAQDFAAQMTASKITDPTATLSPTQAAMLLQALEATGISAFDMTVHGDATGLTLLTRTQMGAARVFVPCLSADFTIGVSIKYLAEAVKIIGGGGQISVRPSGSPRIICSPELDSFDMSIVAPLNHIPVEYVSCAQGEMYV